MTPHWWQKNNHLKLPTIHDKNKIFDPPLTNKRKSLELTHRRRKKFIEVTLMGCEKTFHLIGPALKFSLSHELTS
jgi:hypothetical protein